MATPANAAAPLPVTPLRWRSLLLWAIPWTLLALVFYTDHPSGFINWYATFAWGLPIGIMTVGVLGAYKSGQLIKAEQAEPDPGVVKDKVFVTIITKGSNDVLGALTRAVESLVHFRARFPNAVGHVVIDEGAGATEAIKDLCRRVSGMGIKIELLIVPSTYTTPNDTKFKARAACYAQEVRERAMGSTPHWLYQLDDDTAVWKDTVTSLAKRVKHPRGALLAQGILVFPREFCPSWLMWLVDAIRPGDDLGRFAWTTGRGRPLNGCHGENLLVHSSALKAIGWDFGSKAIVEDSHFALTFSGMFKGKSAWITSRCYGASPANAVDFVKQRVRWAEGMTREAFFERKRPLRDRLMIIHNMIIWGTGVLQPALVVFMVSWIVEDYNVAPVAPWVAVLWILSVSYTCWIYYAGLWANARASGRRHPRVIDIMALLPVVFLVASPLEGLSGTIGFFKCFLGYTPLFHVISKPK